MKKPDRSTIKSWAADDRPREKLLKNGIRSLSNAELIALLIGSGSSNESAVELSKRILQSANNNFDTLAKMTIPDLINRFKGIGTAKAVSIVAALEIGKRRSQSVMLKKKRITQSKDVFDYFHPLLCDLPYEEFWILLLNRSNKIIKSKKISQGGVSATMVDVRIIMKESIEKLASGIVLCHNHPSGNIKPGKADIKITRKLKKITHIFDINLLDHIIVSDEGYYSFADEGLL